MIFLRAKKHTARTIPPAVSNMNMSALYPQIDQVCNPDAERGIFLSAAKSASARRVFVRIIDLYGMRFEVFAKMSQDDSSELAGSV